MRTCLSNEGVMVSGRGRGSPWVSIETPEENAGPSFLPISLSS